MTNNGIEAGKAAAIWVRVSHTDGTQDTENQLRPLEAEALRRGLSVVRVFDVSGSVWTPGKIQGAVSELIRGIERREYSVILCWALDRLTREGLEATVRAVRRIEEAGGSLVSFQEPWIEQSGEMRDLLLAFIGWAARFESSRRSERVKAGLAKRKAQGGHIGRKPGARDRVPRNRSGYAERYDREGRQRVRSKQTRSPNPEDENSSSTASN